MPAPRKTRQSAPAEGPPHPPQTALPLETWGRRVSRSRPPQYDAPHGDEPPNRTQRRQKTEPSENPKTQRRTHEKHKNQQEARRSRPVYAPPRPHLRTPSSVTTSLLLSMSHTPSSFALRTAGGPPTACRGLRRVCLRFCRTPSSQAL